MNKSVVLTMTRYALFGIGAALASKGYINEQSAEQIAGYALGIVQVVWGVIESTEGRKVKTTAALPNVESVTMKNGIVIK